jgi:hypothetical protein
MTETTLTSYKKDYSTIPETPAFKVWLGLVIFSFIEVILIFLLEPLLRQNFPPLNADTGASDYYWTLNMRNIMTMIVTWTFYGAHQASVWLVIFWGKNTYEGKTLNQNKLLKYTVAMAVIMVSFTFLHLIQTQIWYDGLAQDVPIWTSQGSVIVMLALLLVMQNPRRGLIFGKKEKKLMRPEVAKVFMRSHPYIFGWALVYTFWFHPMDSSPALLSGFFFMGLLFVQIVVAYTQIHVNKWWLLVLESFVALHGTVVAIAQWLDFGANPPMWPMFLLGFTAMVVFTYIFGLGLPKWACWLIIGLYGVLILFIYLTPPFGFGRELNYLLRLEILWIPMILYLIAFIAAIIAHGYLLITRPKSEKKD